MKKKVLQLESFTENFQYELDVNKNKLSKQYLWPESIKKLIDTNFEKLFNILIENSLDNETRKILIEFKVPLNNLYWSIIIRQVKKTQAENDPLVIAGVIFGVLSDLFYLPSLIFATLFGNNRKMNDMLKRSKLFSKGIAGYNLKIYNEIWERIDRQMNETGDKKYRSACFNTALRHRENKEDYENPQRLYKRFIKFMRTNHISSLEDYKYFLSLIGK